MNINKTDRQWIAWLIAVVLIVAGTLLGVQFPQLPPTPGEVVQRAHPGQITNLTGLIISAPTTFATATPAAMVDSAGLGTILEIRDATTPIAYYADGGNYTTAGGDTHNNWIKVAGPTAIATATPVLVVDSTGLSQIASIRDGGTEILGVRNGGGVVVAAPTAIATGQPALAVDTSGGLSNIFEVRSAATPQWYVGATGSWYAGGNGYSDGRITIANVGLVNVATTVPTATPAFAIQQAGLGNILEVRDGTTSVFQIEADGNALFDAVADVALIVAQANGTPTQPVLTIEDSSATDVMAFKVAPTTAGGFDFIDLTDTIAVQNGSDAVVGIDMNLTGADATGTGNTLYGLDIDLTTADAQVVEKAIDVSDTDFDYAIDAGPGVIFSSAQTIFEDFWGDALPGELVLLSGSDDLAVDPAIVANEQYGVITLVSGNDGANCATDCSQFNFGTVYKANQGGLVFETRLHIDSALTNASVCAGFTDVVTIEAPVSIGGSDARTWVADDAVVFCYDTASDTDEWFVLGRANTTEATGTAAAGVAPVADTYQVLRIEVDPGGADARFYIAGALVGTLTANAVTATDLLTPFVSVDTNAAASVTVDVDYVFASANR